MEPCAPVPARVPESANNAVSAKNAASANTNKHEPRTTNHDNGNKKKKTPYREISCSRHHHLVRQALHVGGGLVKRGETDRHLMRSDRLTGHRVKQAHSQLMGSQCKNSKCMHAGMQKRVD
jgi:hypothetical protein